jgi:Transcriptional regulators
LRVSRKTLRKAFEQLQHEGAIETVRGLSNRFVATGSGGARGAIEPGDFNRTTSAAASASATASSPSNNSS